MDWSSSSRLNWCVMITSFNHQEVVNYSRFARSFQDRTDAVWARDKYDKSETKTLVLEHAAVGAFEASVF